MIKSHVISKRDDIFLIPITWLFCMILCYSEIDYMDSGYIFAVLTFYTHISYCNAIFDDI